VCPVEKNNAEKKHCEGIKKREVRKGRHDEHEGADRGDKARAKERHAIYCPSTQFPTQSSVKAFSIERHLYN
jgi:hypothetical protein